MPYPNLADTSDYYVDWVNKRDGDPTANVKRGPLPTLLGDASYTSGELILSPETVNSTGWIKFEIPEDYEFFKIHMKFEERYTSLMGPPTGGVYANFNLLSLDTPVDPSPGIANSGQVALISTNGDSFFSYRDGTGTNQTEPPLGQGQTATPWFQEGSTGYDASVVNMDIEFYGDSILYAFAYHSFTGGANYAKIQNKVNPFPPYSGRIFAVAGHNSANNPLKRVVNEIKLKKL